MWKIAVGFIIFAALTLYVLNKGGDIDMSGEKHGIELDHAPAAKASAPAAPAAPASDAASAPAPAASK